MFPEVIKADDVLARVVSLISVLKTAKICTIIEFRITIPKCRLVGCEDLIIVTCGPKQLLVIRFAQVFSTINFDELVSSYHGGAHEFANLLSTAFLFWHAFRLAM